MNKLRELADNLFWWFLKLRLPSGRNEGLGVEISPRAWEMLNPKKKKPRVTGKDFK